MPLSSRRRPLAFAALTVFATATGMPACASSAIGTTTNSERHDDGGTIPGANDGGSSDAPAKVWPKTRFASSVESFKPGKCAGFGKDGLPNVVLGPPVGFGLMQGSTDVVSLGEGGEIVVSVAPNEIIDGPGPDFVVFENAFFVGGNPKKPYADLGEVSISEDGVTWFTFPCTAKEAPYGSCAGWHPVYSSPINDVSPLDPANSGGDLYDIAESGMTKVRFIRIVDKSVGSCNEEVDNFGFDLDGVAVLHGSIVP